MPASHYATFPKAGGYDYKGMYSSINISTVVAGRTHVKHDPFSGQI